MNTQTFINILEENKDKALLFEYAPNLLVGTNYHITEVKHTTIDSVDCGAQTDNWKETVIQLWESPKELGKRDYMKVYKALAILNKVGKMKTFTPTAELKIEYSNATFHTTQQFVQSIEISDSNLIVKLTLDKTQCKANEICGIPEEKELITNSQCTPNSGCC